MASRAGGGLFAALPWVRYVLRLLRLDDRLSRPPQFFGRVRALPRHRARRRAGLPDGAIDDGSDPLHRAERGGAVLRVPRLQRRASAVPAARLAGGTVVVWVGRQR